jgi:Tol biopolymer transport system component
VAYSGASVAIPRYAQGHLLYQDGRRVLAAPFDLKTSTMTGAAVPLVDDASEFEVSASGRLVYVPVERGGRVVSVQRDGSAEVLLDEGRRYELPRVSPDGRDLAVMIMRESRSDVAVFRLATRSLSARLTTDGSSNSPTWSPDGRDLVFRTPGKLLIQPADGSRASQAFLESQDPRLAGTSSLAPGAFLPDGSAYLFVVHSATGTGADIWKLELTGQRRAIPLIQRQRDQWAVRVSPDGRWMSYTSNESGQFEIYISPLTGNGPAIKVSSDGGREAVWSPRGGELFYRVGDRMMAVPIDTSSSSPAGVPRPLFRGQYVSSDLPHYAVTADGQHFIMIQGADAGRAIQVVDHALPR